MDLSKLTKGEKIVLGAGLVLIIDLLFLPWHHVSIGSGLLGLSIKVNRTAIQSPNGLWGWLAVLVAIVMVAQIVAAKFTSAKLPTPPIPWSRVHLIAGVAVIALLVIKLFAETSFLGFGAFLGLALGAAVAFGGFTISKEPETSGAGGWSA
jgi:hypothetical protein